MRNLVECKKNASAGLEQDRQETGVPWEVGPLHLGAPVLPTRSGPTDRAATTPHPRCPWQRDCVHPPQMQ